MNNAVNNIPLINLLWVFSLTLGVIIIYACWSIKVGNIVYGTLRMLVQLILIGYFLTYIFESGNPFIVVGLLGAMLVIASSIALRPIRIKRKGLYLKVLTAISTGGGLTLGLVVFGVLELEPWYEPHYILPLAGMIFANSMNAASLAAERFETEIKRGGDYFEARSIALKAALIPLTNLFFAVGLVSLPGMMTGQILSGISPLLAARYQIMVMCMIFGSAGISSALYLTLLKKEVM